MRHFLEPPIQGVVLQCYGAGNMPSNRQDILEALQVNINPQNFPSRLPSLLQAATSAGVLVVSCTQCSNGAVSGIYETGAALIDAGVIPGSDITPEAALTKLSWVKPKPKIFSRFKNYLMVNGVVIIECRFSHAATGTRLPGGAPWSGA